MQEMQCIHEHPTSNVALSHDTPSDRISATAITLAAYRHKTTFSATSFLISMQISVIWFVKSKCTYDGNRMYYILVKLCALNMFTSSYTRILSQESPCCHSAVFDAVGKGTLSIFV